MLTCNIRSMANLQVSKPDTETSPIMNRRGESEDSVASPSFYMPLLCNWWIYILIFIFWRRWICVAGFAVHVFPSQQFDRYSIKTVALRLFFISVEVATRASYFGQRTIFGVISHLFPTMSFFHFFQITVQAGIPMPSFSSVLLLGDWGPYHSFFYISFLLLTYMYLAPSTRLVKV